MARFDSRVAVVTGGSTGIGLATARLLAAEGARVVLAGRDRTRGEDAVAMIRRSGGAARFLPTDVADDFAVAELAHAAAEDTGRIDIWFNNAGTEGTVGPLDQVDDRVVTELLATNVKGVYSGIRHAARYMAPGAVIVNNASFVGTAAAVPIAVAYGATKAAVVSMTRAAAAALADRGVRVLAVCPYIVDTPMVDRLTGGAGPEARMAFARAFAPSGELTGPEEVAAVVADLCTPTATATGQVLLVDAGGAVIPLRPDSGGPTQTASASGSEDPEAVPA